MNRRGCRSTKPARHLGVSPDAGEFISRGLFPPNRTLYRHQLDAWRESQDGRAVIVTSATNSGKTECYLIPVFAHLAEQSAQLGRLRSSHASLVELPRGGTDGAAGT